jgi:hypothetical protein
LISKQVFGWLSNMNFKRAYRLGEYRIIEYENGLLRWETYSHFGVQRSGICFILGNVLIIGNWSHEEIGYLKLEFFEQLQKLPVWTKTRYYCYAFELLDVVTIQSLTNGYLEQSLRSINNTALKSRRSISPGTFRLGRYRITATDNGAVSWQTYGGLDRVVGGPCIIESNILFIGLQEYDEGNQNKREFLNKLNRLPRWDKTIAWCRGMVLRNCLQQQEIEKPDTTPITIPQSQGAKEDHSLDEKPSVIFSARHEEKPKRLLLLCFKWLERAWHRIRGGKRWLKYLIPLFVAGLLLGLVLLWYSVEKKSHFPHGNKQHHHEHDDD